MYRIVRQIRVRQEIRGYRHREIIRSRGHGVALTLSIQDPLAEGWYDRDSDGEDSEVAACREHGLVEGATVFDIGAHQAVLALVLADIVRPSGRVIAVEAERHNVTVAHRNLELNPELPVTLVAGACSARSGRIAFEDSLNGHISNGRIGIRRVRAVTVDELADTYGVPDVVYLDIEGFELQALSGAQRTMANGATFVIEVHGGGQLEAAGGSAAELAHLLARHGYSLSYVTEDDAAQHAPLRPVAPGDVLAGARFHLLAVHQSP